MFLYIVRLVLPCGAVLLVCDAALCDWLAGGIVACRLATLQLGTEWNGTLQAGTWKDRATVWIRLGWVVRLLPVSAHRGTGEPLTYGDDEF